MDPALIRIPRMPLFWSSGSPSYLIRTQTERCTYTREINKHIQLRISKFQRSVAATIMQYECQIAHIMPLPIFPATQPDSLFLPNRNIDKNCHKMNIYCKKKEVMLRQASRNRGRMTRLRHGYDVAGPALVQHLEGVLGDLAGFNLLLECWSIGVLESWRQDKHLL